ncbi:MAG TPA: ABC transporter permease, partial [Bryobacteraceae bacterium]
GQLTSCNYFDVLNEPPVLGRAFIASECAAEGAGPVVVLNHDLWRNAFGADPAIAGKKVVLNRQLLTVVGVAPQGFQGTEAVAAAFWVPITMQPALEHNFNWLGKADASWLVVLGRTKPGVSLDHVRADLGVIAGRIDQLTPGRKTSLLIETASLLGMPEAQKIVFGVGALLLAAVGMVLLIACANVANLLLARAAGRHKEIAIRLSVGASRGRLVRQLLTESMLIALLGGALGSLIAVWSFQGIVKFILLHLPHGTPPLMLNVAPDFRVLGYAMIMTIVTGIVFGLAPAMQASRPDLNSVLKDAGSGLVGRSGAGGFLRNALVGAQVCVCMVLLIGAGLLLRGLYLAQTIDPGFNLKNVAIVSFDLRGLGYDAPHAALFNRHLVGRLAGLPGVDSVAKTGVTPLSDSHRGTVFTLLDGGGQRQVEINSVSPEYFSMLGIPIVRGRNFTDEETKTGAPVTIATESTARRFWPGQDPIGKSIAGDDSIQFQVIGVARDTQVSHLARSNETYLYFPAGPKEQIRLHLLVHSSDGFASTAKGIQAAVRALDPDVVADVAKLEDNLEFWRTPPRIFAILAGSLGALGLLLASIGVYGVVSYSVSGRIREIGLRMTLGADAREVMKLILRQAMRPVLIGAVIGIGGCAAVSRILSSMLFGLSAHDPVSFILVPVFLLSIALAASYIPARRAMRVDPMVALRYE